MSSSAPNPSPSTPDAAEMLAYVEGALDVAGELRLRRTLRGAPEVLARLDAMRRDRAALRTAMLADPAVPASLRQRVDEALSREALIATPRAGRLTLPAHEADVVVPALGAPLRPANPWRSTKLVTALSMAAAVALVAGGLFLTLRPAGPARTTHASGPIAAADRAAEALQAPGLDSNAIARAPALDAPAPREGEDRTPSEAALPEIASGASAPDVTPPTSTRLLPGVVARAEVMALAEQHRLALRIASDEPRAVVSALEQAVDLSRSGGLDRAPWRVRPDAPPTLASALGVSLRGLEELAAPPAPSIEEELASLPGPDAGIAEADRWLLRPTDDALAVYLAEVDLTEAAIDAFKRELARESDPLALTPDMFREGAAPDAGFVALADPIDQVLGHTTLLVPADDVIWWYQPPRRWAKRTLVPVIVERRE